MSDQNPKPAATNNERPEISIGSPVGAPAVNRLSDTKFRIALLADFSGRANRGHVASGEDIANQKPIVVDFDSIDEAIARFQPRLRIPVGGGESFLDFAFNQLDDFHIDSVFESHDVIDSVLGIGRRIGRSVEKAMKLFNKWGDRPVPPVNSSPARGIAIPEVAAFSDFASHVSQPTVPATAVTAETGPLLEALCAPYIRPLVTSGANTEAKLKKAAADAANAAAREFLQHPDFQTVEGAWREVDWLLRRTNRNPNIEVVLFDVSAEDFVADLANDKDITETGLHKLLVEKTAEGVDAEPWAAVIGRYQFDFSSSHADLLGRVAKIGQRLNAPFLTGFTNKLLDADLKIKDKELVKAWMELRSRPESAYLGIGLPGFLLRMPYGKKGMTLDSFELEEFSPRAGSRGFLWGNPGTFIAALLAKTFTDTGQLQFDANANRVLDQLPIFALHLPNGDSVTFCSEKRFAASTAEQTAGLGLIPLQAMKDRDSIVATEVRSINSANRALAGPWAGPAAATQSAAATDTPPPTETAAAPTTTAPAATPPSDTNTPTSSDSGLDPELAALLGDTPSPATEPPSTATPTETADSGLDPELAALLGESPPDPAPETSAVAANEQPAASGLDPELAALLGESPSTAPAGPAAAEPPTPTEIRARPGTRGFTWRNAVTDSRRTCFSRLRSRSGTCSAARRNTIRTRCQQRNRRRFRP